MRKEQPKKDRLQRFEIELIANGSVKFCGVPIADQQQILLDAFKIKHHFEPEFYNISSGMASGARPSFVDDERFIDPIEHLFHQLVEHTIAQ